MRARLTLALAVAALGPRLARAQGGDVGLQSFRPAIDSRGHLTVDGADLLRAGQISFGLTTTWSEHTLGDVVDDVITPRLQAAAGLTSFLEIGAALPFHIIGGAVSAQGPGDLVLSLKLRLLPGAAALGTLTTRAGYPRGSFLGDDQTLFAPALLLEHAFGRLRLGANGGWRPRRPRAFDGGVAAAELPFGAAASVALSPGRIDLVGEVFGALPLGGEGWFPLEAALGLKLYLARSSFLTAGGGMGLLRDRAGSPAGRLFVGIVFEPRPARSARGALADRAHPPRPERDADVVAPALEPACADAPAGPGWAPRTLARRAATRIDIYDRVHFATNEARILPESFPILDAVAAVLRDNPDVERLEVQGHADERGSSEHNQRLTDARAAAVRDYLVARGVDARRLQARGYGESRPLARAHDEAAWAQNRRVELVILAPGAP